MPAADAGQYESSPLQARLTHDCFKQPDDPHSKVWRYMTLPKFVSLLTSGYLHMTRLDKLDDKYEGRLSRKTIESIDTYLRKQDTSGWTEENMSFYERSRSNTFISCWHMNEHESEAMWRLYCGACGGIAIQTTYDKLVKSIASEFETYLGIVNYVDYTTATFQSGNAYWPVMHKRISFVHENEVRLVRYWGDPPYPDKSPECLHHPWCLEESTSIIAVDPYQSAYFYEAVASILQQFMPSLLPRLQWSGMKA